MSAHYKYACMSKAWIRKPAMILLTIPLTIYVLGVLLYEEFPDFVAEWVQAWRGYE